MSFFDKRFWVSLGVGLVVWFITVIIQAYADAPKFVALFTQSKCSATGYPISFCIRGLPEIIVYLLNTIFWFLMIYLSWGWFKKAKS